VTIEEVRRAIDVEHGGGWTAAKVVEAAERFRLRGRGLGVEHPAQLATLSIPNIAHMASERGRFPRSLEGGLDGHFVVVTAISPRRVCWIDPYVGQITDEPAEFLEFASGVFLVFDEAIPLPRAKLPPS